MSADKKFRIFFNILCLAIAIYLGFRTFEFSIYTQMGSKVLGAISIIVLLISSISLAFKFVTFKDTKLFQLFNPIVLFVLSVSVTTFSMLAFNYTFNTETEYVCAHVVNTSTDYNYKKEAQYTATIESDEIHMNHLERMVFPIDKSLFDKSPDSVLVRMGLGMVNLKVVKGVMGICGTEKEKERLSSENRADVYQVLDTMALPDSIKQQLYLNLEKSGIRRTKD